MTTTLRLALHSFASVSVAFAPLPVHIFRGSRTTATAAYLQPLMLLSLTRCYPADDACVVPVRLLVSACVVRLAVGHSAVAAPDEQDIEASTVSLCM